MSVTADLGQLSGVSAAEWVRRTRAGELSVADGVAAVLAALPAVDAARSRALALDELPARQRGPLHGLPVAVKEEFDVAGVPTTFGTAAQRTPTADSALVASLRGAGAVIVATTRMPEFGAWPVTESQTGGVTRNPLDPARTPGGSSGGSAALVAAGCVPVAVGSDGGGSLRIPAAHCGLVGLKATRGTIDSAPHDQLWVSLGVGGVMARDVSDLRLVLGVLNPEAFAPAEPRPLKIATTTRSTTVLARAHRDHRTAVRVTARALAAAGHEVVEFGGGPPDPSLAFVPQYLSGVAAARGLLDHPERVEPRTRVLAGLGRLLPRPLVDASVRRGEVLAERVDELLGDADVLLLPTVGSRPLKAGSFLRRGVVTSALGAVGSIAFTALFNVTGHPAIAVPAGLGGDGLPVSVQLVARRGEDAKLLALAAGLSR